MIAIFCNGLHPEAKVVALQMKQNNAMAIQNGCCFPALWPPTHPNAGAAHPNAGALSLDLLAIFVHKDFNTKLNATLFRLKAQPEINLADSSSGSPERNQGDFIYFSQQDVFESGCNSIHDYIYYHTDKPNSASQMRTCNNCGRCSPFR